MKAGSSSDFVSTRPSRAARLAAPALAVVALFFFGGCATSYEVKVDALAKPNAADAISYQILNRNREVREDSLRYKEAASLVRTALSGKGMYEAHDAEKADIVVEMDYGIGPPQSKRETVSDPVYLTIPGQIRTERVQVGTDRNGNPVYQTITVQDPPTTEFAGYRERIITVIVYEKFLKMSARENKPAEEGRPPNEVWTLDVVSEGESRDLRKNLPILVAASIEYVGKDTHGQKTSRIKDTNSDVVFVKKGM